LLANGYPVRGSLYFAGAPVTAQTKETGPFAFAEPTTTGTFPNEVST
jgi:hypothetical protein